MKFLLIFFLVLSNTIYAQLNYNIENINYLSNTRYIEVFLTYSNSDGERYLEITKGDLLNSSDLDTRKQTLIICKIADNEKYYNPGLNKWIIKIKNNEKIKIKAICYCKDNGFGYDVGDELTFANSRVIDYNLFCSSQAYAWTVPEHDKIHELINFSFNCKSDEGYEHAIVSKVTEEVKNMLKRENEPDYLEIIKNTEVIVNVDSITGIIHGDIEIKTRGISEATDYKIMNITRNEIITPEDRKNYLWGINFTGDLIDVYGTNI